MKVGDDVTVPSGTGSGRRSAVVERIDGDRVLVRVDGKRRGFDAARVKAASSPKTPPVRLEPILPPPAAFPGHDDDALDWHGPGPSVLAAVRSVGTVPAVLVAVPKVVTARNEAFLEHLRTRPCDHCGRPPRSQPAHFGPDRGMALKCSDYHACSLCWDCHNEEWHQHGRLPGLDREESMLVQWRGAALAIVTFSFAMDADFWADLVKFLEGQIEGRRRA